MDNYASLRIHFPDDEARFPWLTLLLDAFAIIDYGIALSIKQRGKGKIACKEGCSNCCRSLEDIPVYPIEVAGIRWFAAEKPTGPKRQALKARLSGFKKGDCPFLIDNSCSVYVMRPFACRQFSVFNMPCKEGEDPYYARRADVLTPQKEFTNRAFSLTLPFYGITDEDEKKYYIESGLIHSQAAILQSYDWRELKNKMDEFDKGR